MNRIKLLTVLLLCCLTGIRAATPPECVFEHYSSLDGLPHNAISDMYRDSRGFLWICTWYGLSRFDGYKFKNYRTLPGDHSSFSHNRFLKVTEDAKGYLWFSSYDHKLYRFDRAAERFEDVPHSVKGYTDRHFKIDRYLNSGKGDTWIALSGAGLIRAVQQEGKPLGIVNYFDDNRIGKQISLLAEDSRNNIWAVSESGITRFTPASEGFEITLVSRLTDVCAFEETEGRICFGAGTRLLVFDPGLGTIREIEMPGNNRITALEASPNGETLYIGTLSSGIVRYDPKTGTMIPDRDNPGRIRSLVSDSHGTLWVTTADPGIIRYRPESGDYKQFSQKLNAVSYYVDTVTRIVESGEMLWVKMNRVGFGYYDRERDEVEPFYNDPDRPDCRMGNGVTCFVADGNVLWLSTHSRGLEKMTIIDQKADLFVPQSDIDNRASHEIRALLEDSHDHLWIGNKSGELFCYDSLGRLLRKYPDATSGPLGLIYALKEDNQGNIWIGTKGEGLFRMTPEGTGHRFRHFFHNKNDRFSLGGNDVYTIEQDTCGRIWIGTYGGAISMLESPDAERFVTVANNFPGYPTEQGMRVRYLHCTPEGKMIAATVEGLILFDPNEPPEKMRFRPVQKIPDDIHSPGNNDIIHIFQDSKQRLWFSTFGGGLNLLTGYDASGEPRFEIYSSQQGLMSNIVFAATEDRHGQLWLSTENGIARFDPESGTFSNYSKYDGIPAASFSEATALTDCRGRVLFGSTNDLYVLDPDRMHSERESYRLSFTDFEIRNQEVPVGENSPLRRSITETDRIVLPYDYSIFRIGFASLNFNMQPRLGYMYRLEGYDQDWSAAKNLRSATYSNVPPGKYRFRVRCFNEDNRERGDEIAVAVTIRPPWWKTTLAYIGYILVILLVLYLILRTLYTMITLRDKVRLEQKMTELKLRFFTNISHELRTPLTLILGGVEEVSRSKSLTPREEQSISLAHKNAKRMLNLINQLLDFRKIVNDKMKLRIRRADLIPLAEGVADDFREMAAERNIEFVFSVSARTMPLWADPGRIESVIYNLLANAFKFTPENGKIELSISQREGDEWITIGVKDSGIGIPKEKQEYIFERFAQASDAVTPNTEGTGIGLSLCKEIVELHHGEIGVESRPGEGALFSVRLRTGNAHFSMAEIDFRENNGAYVSASEYLTDDSSSDSRSHRVETTAPADAFHLLLVEDNHELRIFLYNHLAPLYHVTEAADGEEALRRIRENAPDIVVTDLMMPHMDGNQLTEAIRSDFATSHIPVIMLTAKSEAETRIEAMKYGADGYITKPFSVELLLARIDNLLANRRKLFEKYSSQAAGSPRIVDLKPSEIVVTDRDEEFIKNTMSWIDANIENSDLTIDQLASHLGMGRTTMYGKLKSLTGKSPVELIKEYRVNKAMMLLRSGQFAVSEVAYRVGFSDPSYFSRCFKDQFKMSPAEFLKRSARGEQPLP